MMKKIKKSIGKAFVDFRFYLSASNNIFYSLFYKHFYNPRKGSLSEFISEYSQSVKHEFTVIQVGANDGFTNDPIHKYIKRDNWKGVLLEPQPYVFNKYLNKLHRKSKTIHPFNAALGTQNGETTLYKIGFSNSRWATGIASFSKEQLESCFESGHVHRCADKEGVYVPDNPEKRIIGEKVEVITASTLMKKFDISNIDLLQIDAEGFDFEVIKLFNIAETKPKVICFEGSHFSDEEAKECYSFLERHGYNHQKIKADIIAKHESIS